MGLLQMASAGLQWLITHTISWLISVGLGEDKLEHFRGIPSGEQIGDSQDLAWLWGIQRRHIVLRIFPKEKTKGIK